MRRFGLTVLFSVLAPLSWLLPLCALGEDVPDWTTYQGNASHDGYVPVVIVPSGLSVLWQKSFGSLNPVTAADGMVFLSQPSRFGSGSGLRVLNASTGNLLWSYNFDGVDSINPPAYADGKVYIQTGKGTSSPPPYLSAFNAATGSLAFQSQFSAQWENYLAPTPYNGSVYIDGGYYGGMYSFNGASGAQTWFGSVPQYDQWTPAVNGQYAYAYTGSGSTTPISGIFTVLDRTTGATVARITDTTYNWTGYSMNAAVALGQQNDAFTINGGRIVCWDTTIATGQTPHIAWSQSNSFTGQVTVANGVVYALNGGALTALDETSGQTLWTWGTGLTGTILATKNNVFVGNSNTTYAVNLLSHQPVWSYGAGGSLSLSENRLYIAGSNGTLTAISAAFGPPPFVWNVAGGGSWAVQSNWTPTGPAAGIDYLADFSQQSLGADAIVTLDGDQSIGNITFGDAGGNHNWTLASGSGGKLTLTVTSGSPEIAVTNGAATIAAQIAGNQGLLKKGAGTLVLSGVNSYSGVTSINEGTLLVTADINLGASSLSINGGTLEVAGNLSSPRNIAMKGTGAIQIDAGNTYAATIGAAISGSGGLNKTGGGTLDLTIATTSYSGPTTVNAGILSAGNLTNTSAINVNGGVLKLVAFNSAAATTIGATGAANVSGSNLSLAVVNNAGTLNFTSTTGVITLAGLTGNGTTSFSSGATFPTLAGGIVNIAGPATISTASGGTANLSGATAAIATLNGGTINLALNTALTVSAGTQASGEITGAGSLTKTSSSTLILARDNTYTGDTSILAGILQIGNGGTTGSVGGNLTNNATLAFNRSDAYTFAGNIAGTGGVNQSGTGVLILTGANNYAGGTKINSGTLKVVTDSNLGSGALTINAGTYEVAAALSSARAIALGNAAATIQVDPGATYTGTAAATINGSGGLTKTGGGILNLIAATPTYSGPTVVNAGTFSVASLPSTSAITVNGGVFNATNYKSTAALTIANGATANISGTGLNLAAVSNSGQLNFTGATGVIALSGLTGTGVTEFSAAAQFPTLSGGTVSVAGVATISTVSGGVANLNGTTSSINSLNGGAVNVGLSTALSVTAGTQASGVISGGGSLVKTTASTLILAGNNSYTGGTLITAGILQIGNGGATGSAVGNITNNATLTFNRSDNYTFAGNIDGSGVLNQSGTGVLTLTGINTYSGGTKINSGTLRIGAPGALVIGGPLTIGSGATLDLNGVNCAPSSITGAGNIALGGAVLTINNLSDTIGGVKISGAGSVQKSGAGKLTLVSDNTYLGPTIISAGMLQIGSGGTIGNILGDVTNNSTLSFNRSDAFVFGGAISGAGAVENAGGGSVTLTGANTYTGGTTVNSGIFKMGGAQALPVATSLSVAPSAVFDLNGFNAVVSAVSGAGTVKLGSALLTVRSNSNAFVSASIQGSGGVTKDGSGDVTLTGSNAYTGATVANAGRLILPVDSMSSSYTAGSNASIRVDHATMNLGSRFFRALSGGVVEYDGATLNGGFLRGPGSHVIAPGSTTTFLGVSTFNSTVLQQNGPTLLQNFMNGGQLTNAAPLTWDGGINSGSGSFVVNNIATVQDWSNLGTVTVNAGGAVNNQISSMVSTGGQISILPGGQINTNSDSSGATLDLHNSLLINNGTLTGSLNVYYGSLAKGAGAFGNIHLFDGGMFSPGNSPSLVNVGNYSQAVGGVLSLEIGGSAASEFDSVHAGAMALGGTLQVSLVNGFQPAEGASFDILDWGSISGTFSVLGLPKLNGALGWNTSQLYTTGTLSIMNTFLPGDFDRDGKLSAADLSAMLRSLTDLDSYAAANSLSPSQLTSIGDFDNSGSVNNRDIQGLINLLALQSSAPQGAEGSGALVPVSEPATLLLATLAVPAIGLALRHGRKRRHTN